MGAPLRTSYGRRKTIFDAIVSRNGRNPTKTTGFLGRWPERGDDLEGLGQLAAAVAREQGHHARVGLDDLGRELVLVLVVRGLLACVQESPGFLALGLQGRCGRHTVDERRFPMQFRAETVEIRPKAGVPGRRASPSEAATRPTSVAWSAASTRATTCVITILGTRSQKVLRTTPKYLRPALDEHPKPPRRHGTRARAP